MCMAPAQRHQCTPTLIKRRGARAGQGHGHQNVSTLQHIISASSACTCRGSEQRSFKEDRKKENRFEAWIEKALPSLRP